MIPGVVPGVQRKAPAEGPSLVPQCVCGVAWLAVGVSSQGQKEGEETSGWPGNRKGEDAVFLQGSFISCLRGFSGTLSLLCNFFSPCPFGVEGCGLPGEEEVGREQDRRRCCVVASWDPGGVIWGAWVV